MLSSVKLQMEDVISLVSVVAVIVFNKICAIYFNASQLSYRCYAAVMTYHYLVKIAFDFLFRATPFITSHIISSSSFQIFFVDHSNYEVVAQHFSNQSFLHRTQA